MYIENGRDLVRGVLLLLFVAIAYWVNLMLGLVLIAIMSLLILQSTFTNWCPADLFLRLLGVKSRAASKC